MSAVTHAAASHSHRGIPPEGGVDRLNPTGNISLLRLPAVLQRVGAGRAVDIPDERSPRASPMNSPKTRRIPANRWTAGSSYFTRSGEWHFRQPIVLFQRGRL